MSPSTIAALFLVWVVIAVGLSLTVSRANRRNAQRRQQLWDHGGGSSRDGDGGCGGSGS